MRHRRVRWSWMLCLGMALIGCGTAPPTRLHSLLPSPAAASASATVISTPAAASWELAGISLPAQVDQPQWLVRLADDSLVSLEHDRWVAPLTDEIRGALAQHITAALQAAPLPNVVPAARWRMGVEVMRLDAAPGRYSRWDVAWTLQRAGAATPALRCRGVFEQAAAAGLPALAAAHRANVARLGATLAADLRRISTLPEGSRADCAAA